MSSLDRLQIVGGDLRRGSRRSQREIKPARNVAADALYVAARSGLHADGLGQPGRGIVDDAGCGAASSLSWAYFKVVAGGAAGVSPFGCQSGRQEDGCATQRGKRCSAPEPLQTDLLGVEVDDKVEALLLGARPNCALGAELRGKSKDLGAFALLAQSSRA